VSDFKAKMHQIQLPLPQTPLRELIALPSVFKRPTSKGREGKGRKEEERGEKGKNREKRKEGGREEGGPVKCEA